MSKHTPGPWKMEVGDESSDYAHRFPIIVTDDYEIVGTEGFYSGDLQTDIANATLAAAAPELLEALEHMRRVFADIEGSYGQYEHDALDKADAAIAKAKGEQV